jgi:UPF0716 protein FxsA
VLFLFVLFIAVPLVEIAVLIQVGQWLGVLDTIGLLLLISLLGVWLVKREGAGTLRRIREELSYGRMPTDGLIDGGLLMTAGVLLLVPGFVTDFFGLLLLLPPVRSGARRLAKRRFSTRIAVVGRRSGTGPEGTWDARSTWRDPGDGPGSRGPGGYGPGGRPELGA